MWDSTKSVRIKMYSTGATVVTVKKKKKLNEAASDFPVKHTRFPQNEGSWQQNLGPPHCGIRGALAQSRKGRQAFTGEDQSEMGFQSPAHPIRCRTGLVLTTLHKFLTRGGSRSQHSREMQV